MHQLLGIYDKSFVAGAALYHTFVASAALSSATPWISIVLCELKRWYVDLLQKN